MEYRRSSDDTADGPTQRLCNMVPNQSDRDNGSMEVVPPTNTSKLRIPAPPSAAEKTPPAVKARPVEAQPAKVKPVKPEA